jgi:hypothetical protein
MSDSLTATLDRRVAFLTRKFGENGVAPMFAQSTAYRPNLPFP